MDKNTPKEASLKQNENKVLRNLYPKFKNSMTLVPKFSIGDHVRITKKRKHLIMVTLKGGRKRFLKFQKFNLLFL